MKKSFFIFGVIGAICMTGAWAAQIGEVLGAGNSGYMACPPDCSFLRNANGGLVTPVTCVNRGVECIGGHGGVRFYNEYPSQYVVGEVIEVNKPVVKDIKDTAASAQKLENNSVARAAKTGAKAKKVSDTTVTPASAVEKARMGDGGAVAINCPANCTPDCVILGNVVLCECKDSNGNTCKADVVVSDEVKATATK